MTRRKRRVDPFDKSSMFMSVLCHGGLIAVAWLSTLGEPEPIVFLAYEIEMVSPPPAAQAEEIQTATEELVVERPEPEPLPPEPEVEDPVPVEQPDERPDPPPDPPRETAEQPVEPDEEVTVAATPEEVEEVPEASGEGLNVRMEGLQRDYPAYYDNIIRQIDRCFRWRDGGRWEAVVRFVINRDGSVSDFAWVRRSGSTAFDYSGAEAIECAGREGRLGPLPSDMPWDRQPVQFRFSPPGGEAVPGSDIVTSAGVVWDER